MGSASQKGFGKEKAETRSLQRGGTSKRKGTTRVPSNNISVMGQRGKKRRHGVLRENHPGKGGESRGAE